MGTKKGQVRKTARRAYETKGGKRYYKKKPKPLPKSRKGLRSIFVAREGGWEFIRLPETKAMKDWWDKNIGGGKR